MPDKDSAVVIGDTNLEYGFEFWVPQGVMAPDMVDELRVPGNQFELKGYAYYTIANNTRHLLPRFDLTAWHPLPTEGINGPDPNRAERVSEVLNNGDKDITELYGCWQV